MSLPFNTVTNDGDVFLFSFQPPLKVIFHRNTYATSLSPSDGGGKDTYTPHSRFSVDMLDHHQLPFILFEDPSRCIREPIQSVRSFVRSFPKRVPRRLRCLTLFDKDRSQTSSEEPSRRSIDRCASTSFVVGRRSSFSHKEAAPGRPLLSIYRVHCKYPQLSCYPVIPLSRYLRSSITVAFHSNGVPDFSGGVVTNRNPPPENIAARLKSSAIFCMNCMCREWFKPISPTSTWLSSSLSPLNRTAHLESGRQLYP